MLEPFRGTYTVLVTPFTADGAALDLPALERLVGFQIEEGIDGLIPLGSTGEFLSVSRDERTAVVETTIRAAAGRVPVLVGTGAEDTREAVALAREAEALGAAGVLVIPPFYSVPTDDELYGHYKAIADAIGIPVMVYNNPATANVDLTPPLLARLSTIAGCRYVKESTLDVTRVRDIIAACDGRMEVFAGVLGYESAWLGAIGWVAVCSNVAPRLSADMFRAAAASDRATALPLYRRLAPLLPWVGGPRYVSGTKAALRLTGRDMGPPRPPRLPLPGRDLPALRAVLRGLDAGMDAPSIRLAGPADQPAVEAIVAAAYGHYVVRIGREPGPMRDDYAARIAKRCVHVLEDGGGVRGMVVLVAQDDSMLLDNVAVDPRAQGHGYGRALMAFAEARARDAGFQAITLYTHELMTENQALYARAGYAETHRAEEGGFRRVYMRKMLG